MRARGERITVDTTPTCIFECRGRDFHNILIRGLDAYEWSFSAFALGNGCRMDAKEPVGYNWRDFRNVEADDIIQFWVAAAVGNTTIDVQYATRG